MDVIEEFVMRCSLLDAQLEAIVEISDRVWMAVMLERMKTIIENQEHPEDARKQILNQLKE